MSERTPRIAVLLSGSGRTLGNLLEKIRAAELRAEVGLVIASRERAGAERARGAGLATVVQAGTIPRARLGGLLAEHRIDLVVLAGYLKLLEVPEGWRGRIVNIHPALLPEFGGAGMYGDRVHRAVLASGKAESGCTVHFVDDRFDSGPVIAQERVPVLEGDDAAALAARVFEAECRLYPRAVQLVLDGRVGMGGQAGAR